MDTPHYLIQINHNGGANLSRVLGIPPSSVTVRQALKMYGPEWPNFISFSIIRNPYSRAVAIYTDYRNANKFKILEHNISFLNFLNLTLHLKRKPFHDKIHVFRSQWDWLKDFDGEMGVLYLGTFEEYAASVATFLSYLGHDPSPVLIRPVKESGMKNWEKYYLGVEGKMAKDLIADYWSEDFDNLPYEK